MTHATSGAKEHGGRKDMISSRMYYKIQELKTLRYSERRTARELGIDRATAKKYGAMDEEDYLQYKEESREPGRVLESTEKIL